MKSYPVTQTPDIYTDYVNKAERKVEKKVNWFTRWFDRKCQEAWERARENSHHSPLIQSAPDRGPRLDANGLSLNIYSADGGTVLEFRHYDIKRDRSENALHVISQNENFEERVAQAITMELLRKGMQN